MADIIPLRGGTHDQARSLMPWYLCGALAAEETAQMDAHLSRCAECRADLASERDLAVRIQSLPADLGRGWARLRLRLERPSPMPKGAALLYAAPVRWALGALIAVLAMAAIAAQFLLPPTTAPGASPVGELLVVVRPDTSEQALRDLLRQADARVSDGPTEAGGYVLRVDPSRRDAVLSQLRADPRVAAVRPINGEDRS